MIKYLSLCLFFLAFTHRTVANEEENQRYLRHKSRSSSSRQSIAAIASSEPSFSTLVSVLGKTGLDEVLDCRWSWWCNRYTVFAPPNSGFDALATGEGTKDLFTALTTDDEYAEHLKQLLLYHVVGKSIESSSITKGPVKSLQGENLELTTSGGIKVNEASVINPFDVKATNGRIHTIDSVLLPSFATKDIVDIVIDNPDFSILKEAVIKAGLDDDLMGAKLTVLAPTNDAFIKAGINVDETDKETLIEVLTYHVIAGIVPKDKVPDGTVSTLGGQTIDVSVKKSRRDCGIVINDDVNVIIPDVLAKNGVIHVIDEVLIPPAVAARAPPPPSIVEVVQGNPDFSTLLSLVTTDAPELEGVLSALSSDGPLTVFAPTDKAFEALGALDATPEELAAILTYHVVSGKFLSTDLPDSILVNTVNGKGLAVDARGDGVVLNGNVRVIDANIETSNGVIHVIDTVLIPPKNLVELLTEDGRFGTLLTAVGLVPGLGETLATGGPFTIFAPTDKAFAKVPSNDLSALLKDETALAKVLSYHVSDDFIPAQALPDRVPTLVEGESIRVKASKRWYWWGHWRSYTTVTLDGNVHVVDANAALGSNGVIHAIDGVLFP